MEESKAAAQTNSDVPDLSADQGAVPDSVVDKIRRTLSCLGYAQLSAVQCIADGDEILLTGELDSFYLKQVAQSVAMKIPGVRNVRNEIRVV